MQGESRNWWKVAFVVLAISLVAFAASTLVSAHGGGDGVIHSCVKDGGSITIVGPNASCKANETALDWNQQGVPGVSGYEKVEVSLDVPVYEANNVTLVTANCPAGKKIVGGGAYAQGVPSQVIVLASSPERGNNDYWNGVFYNSGGALNNVQLWVVAICATAAP